MTVSPKFCKKLDLFNLFQASVIKHLSLGAGDEKDGIQLQLEHQVVAVKEVAKATDGKRSK